PKNPQCNTLDATQSVVILHPGYTPLIPMLTFVAYDTGSNTRGVPLGVILDACQILACNTAGFIRKLGSNDDLVSTNSRSILKPGLYTYRVVSGEASCSRYQICTTFRRWTPPVLLPEHWAGHTMGAIGDVPHSNASNFSEVVTVVDGKCAMTGATSRLECCHLVPAAELSWWAYHAMAVKTNDFNGVNSPRNFLTLRSDLAAGMDQGHFVFAPYDGSAVSVCLTDTVADLAFDSHLQAVDLPARIQPWYTYVRFAW
ncbi:hypothetical protein C8R43DRAFT_835714, partial [Mycena crocata]